MAGWGSADLAAPLTGWVTCKPFPLSDLSYLIHSKNNINNNEMIVPGLLIGFFSAVFL